MTPPNRPRTMTGPNWATDSSRARTGRSSVGGRASPARPTASTCRSARSAGRSRTAGSCDGGRRDRPRDDVSERGERTRRTCFHDRRPPAAPHRGARVSSDRQFRESARRRSRRASASATIACRRSSFARRIAIARPPVRSSPRGSRAGPPGLPWPGYASRFVARHVLVLQQLADLGQREAGAYRAVRGCGGCARGPRRRTGGSRPPIGRPAAAGRSPRSSGSPASSRRLRRRLPGCAADAGGSALGRAWARQSALGGTDIAGWAFGAMVPQPYRSRKGSGVRARRRRPCASASAPVARPAARSVRARRHRRSAMTSGPDRTADARDARRQAQQERPAGSRPDDRTASTRTTRAPPAAMRATRPTGCRSAARAPDGAARSSANCAILDDASTLTAPVASSRPSTVD